MSNQQILRHLVTNHISGFPNVIHTIGCVVIIFCRDFLSHFSLLLSYYSKLSYFFKKNVECSQAGKNLSEIHNGSIATLPLHLLIYFSERSAVLLAKSISSPLSWKTYTHTFIHTIYTLSFSIYCHSQMRLCSK